MILVLDNYDSFTYNLVQLFGRMTREILVRRNDQTTPEEIRRLQPKGIVLSPGPGRPENAGITVEVIRQLGPDVPMLGVCLGHQAIGFAFGAGIVHAPSLMHGKTSLVRHNGAPLFEGVENPFQATRYHSLVISPEHVPDVLEVTATSDEGVIMAVQHTQYPIAGVQFHPESILTDAGEHIIRNWLKVHSCS